MNFCLECGKPLSSNVVFCTDCRAPDDDWEVPSEPEVPNAVASAQPTNAFAIVALVLGLMGISLLAVIFGHISLRQINRTGERGRAMALAGTILGWVGIAVAILLIIAVAAALGLDAP